MPPLLLKPLMSRESFVLMMLIFLLTAFCRPVQAGEDWRAAREMLTQHIQQVEEETHRYQELEANASSEDEAQPPSPVEIKGVWKFILGSMVVFGAADFAYQLVITQFGILTHPSLWPGLVGGVIGYSFLGFLISAGLGGVIKTTLNNNWGFPAVPYALDSHPKYLSLYDTLKEDKTQRPLELRTPFLFHYFEQNGWLTPEAFFKLFGNYLEARRKEDERLQQRIDLILRSRRLEKAQNISTWGIEKSKFKTLLERRKSEKGLLISIQGIINRKSNCPSTVANLLARTSP